MLKLTTDRHEASRDLFVTAELLVNFNFLALTVSEIIWGSQIYISGTCTPSMSPSGKFFIPKVSTLPYLMVF